MVTKLSIQLLTGFLISCIFNVLFISNPIFIPQSYAKEREPQDSKQVKCINIKSLVFKGNRTFSDMRLKMRMKSWHSSLLPGNFNCYNEDWMNKDILALVEFYRKKGFPDVEIDHIFKTDGENTKKDGERNIIQINIDEGFEYEIIFKGNHFFSERELKKKIDLVKKGNTNDAGLGRAKVDIRNSYIDAGFQDITVEFHKERKVEKNSEIWNVEFLISEGTRTVVNRLEIKGNKIVSEDEILDSMLTRQKGTMEKGGYNANVLDKDINAIELLYLSKGFLNVKVSKLITVNPATSSELQKNPETQLADIEISISEGIQTIVKSTQIKGLVETLSPSKNVLTPEKALDTLSLRPGEPFREYMVKSDENALSMMVSELGYPHVKVRSDVILNSDKSEASIVWHIQKGRFTRFGNIHYSGNTRVKEDVIAKRMEIEPGKPFSLKKVFATEKRVRESSAVKYAQITAPGLAEMEESPDIEVVIEESKPYFVEAALGYDTEQNLYIDTRVGDNNFLGREIDAWVSANISGIGYRGEGGLKKPFFLGTGIDATSSIYVEDKEEMNKNFGIRTWGYESGFARHLFVRNLMAGLNFKYENRTIYGDADIDIHDKEARNILITSFLLGYDSRDSSVRPSKGLLTTGSVDVYSGFDNDLDRFFKYQIDLRKYLSPFHKVTFALRTRMGYIQPFGTEEGVAKDQLFFLGGTPNVRGFKENMLEYDSNGNPAGGRTTINSTLEARIDLPADFELNCFLDTGRIDGLEGNLESRGFRSALGVGLRYVTPIGPVGLLYGHKLDTEDGESPGRIHFSVGYTF